MKIKKIKEQQRNLCLEREKMYVTHHEGHKKYFYEDFPECCNNLKCFRSKNFVKNKANKKKMDKKQELSLSDSMSFSRKDLLCTMSGIVKDFNCKLSLEPVSKTKEIDIHITRNILDHDARDISKSLRVEDDHQKPLFCIGNVQALRKYPMLKSVNLTDREFKIYSHIKFNNSFTTAIRKSEHHTQQNFTAPDLVDTFETQEVESVFVHEVPDEVSNKMAYDAI